MGHEEPTPPQAATLPQREGEEVGARLIAPSVLPAPSSLASASPRFGGSTQSEERAQGAGGSSAPDISVAVVSYNTCALLRACLRSLQSREADGEASLEIIVADNGSADGTLEMVRAEFPSVLLREMGENIGFGRANNAALQDAQGRFFCLLNSDAETLPGALSGAMSYLEANADAGLIGGQLLWPDGRPQTSWGDDPTLAGVFREQTFLGGWKRRDKEPTPARSSPTLPMREGEEGRTEGVINLAPTSAFPRFGGSTGEERAGEGGVDVDQICGAFMLIRREAWRQVGGFDPHYFMYNEDVDLNVRLRQAGWRVVFLPTARITHHLGASSSADWQKRARMVAAYNESRYYYFSRFGGANAGRTLKVFCLLGAAIRLAGWSVLALAKPSARDKVKLFREVWRRTRAMTPDGAYKEGA